MVNDDRAALDQLLRILRPLVVRYCRSRLGTERGGVAADDVAQEVCLAVLKALPSYTDQGKPFLAFVYGIAGHKVVDAHRHAGRDRSEPTDEVPEGIDDRGGPEQAALDLSANVEMRALLAQLPDKQREILVLRVVVGLSAEETAIAVGSTPGAVRVAQHRRGRQAARSPRTRRGGPSGGGDGRRRRRGRHRHVQYAGRSGMPARPSAPSLTPSTWCSWMLLRSNPSRHAGQVEPPDPGLAPRPTSATALVPVRVEVGRPGRRAVQRVVLAQVLLVPHLEAVVVHGGHEVTDAGRAPRPGRCTG